MEPVVHQSAYIDVQLKAKRLRSEGHVQILETPSESKPYLYGLVEGDHGVYHPLIHRMGRKRFQALCDCTWGSYGEFGPNGEHRAPDSPFRLRMCAHLLALTYEFQARSMFGATAHTGADESENCDWCDKNTFFGAGNRSNPHQPAHDAFGKGTDQMFGSGQLAMPFAGSHIARHDKTLVKNELMKPDFHLEDMDPRHLRGTQAAVTKTGVDYYANSDHFKRTGETFADQNNLGNRHPVVYTHLNAHGQEHNLLLSGHHRAAAALAKGEMLPVRRVFEHPQES